MSGLKTRMQARTGGQTLDVTALFDQADRPGGGVGTEKAPVSRSDLRAKVDNG